ncbi:MAG: formylglycine-generating enzyme family protein [bacterium]|uniref:Formylglycine-generating enzyme family protein n=1 Tax=Candidatus Methylomirabilis tolerans TaxID=3123416 RepID=A0AAJ1AIV3_9BACT|nr:formylglycine-generating enzyme family protein [Candidatus Methylomirabilis sp.]
MDKIVQVTFVLRKIPEPEIGTFIAKVVQDQYKNKDRWSENGWKWKETERVNEPASWNAPEGNQPDHPVVGVSLYEAEAYAKWAGKRLPTEQEWERAARGTDGRVYPWGDEFDKEKCNSWEADIGRTTPVTKYVNGLSPDGCYDMAGNVWEWTASREEDFFVIRGGSWYDATQLVRSAFRSKGMLTFRYDNVGFRCAKTP